MPMTRAHTTSESGFTAVVVAALFLVFAVVAAAVVERNTITQHITRRDTTIAQLTRISNAIIEYSVFNKTSNTNLYPCPARLDLLTSNSSFGDAATDCWNTGVALATSLDVPGSPGNTSMVRGMVPVLKLSSYGITIEDAFDAWNNRIVYVVNRRLTINSTTSSGAQADNPTVTDALTGTTIAPPDFILISYGRDGLGGIKRGDTSTTIPCSASSTVLREENCDTDLTFSVRPTYTGTSATASTYFDDILVWYRQ